jgi:hypothetical protein
VQSWPGAGDLVGNRRDGKSLCCRAQRVTDFDDHQTIPQTMLPVGGFHTPAATN